MGAWAGLAVWTPPDDQTYTLCLFRRLTHHDCPTCGMTRALALLAKGQWRASFERHPLGIPLVAEVLLLWSLAPRWFRDASTRAFARTRLERIALVTVGVFLLVWLLRQWGVVRLSA